MAMTIPELKQLKRQLVVMRRQLDEFREIGLDDFPGLDDGASDFCAGIYDMRDSMDTVMGGLDTILDGDEKVEDVEPEWVEPEEPEWKTSPPPLNRPFNQQETRALNGGGWDVDPQPNLFDAAEGSWSAE